MLSLSPVLTNILQALIAAILIGMIYSLWVSTKAYGGLIGHAIRLLGIGIILLAVVLIERMLVNFNVVINSPNLALAQDIFTLLSLVFLSLGFRRLALIAKN